MTGGRSNRCVECGAPTGSVRRVYCSEHSWAKMLEKTEAERPKPATGMESLSVPPARVARQEQYDRPDDPVAWGDC